MNKRVLLGVVAVVVIVLSGISIWRHYVKPPVQDRLGLGMVGQVAAEETVRLVSSKGQIVVIFFDPPTRGLGGMETVLRTFQTRLRQEKAVAVVATESVPYGTVAPSQRVVELIKRHAAVDAVVLLGGDSALQMDEFTKLVPPFPKLVAVLTFGAGRTKFLLEQGILSLAVETRDQREVGGAQPKTQQESFATRYVVVTPETANVLEVKPPMPGATDSGL